MIVEIRISDKTQDKRYQKYRVDYEKLFDALDRTAINNQPKIEALWDEIKYLNKIYGLTMKYIKDKLNKFVVGDYDS